MPSAESVSNRLVVALPARERDAVLTRCTTVELSFGEIITDPGKRIRHVYFPRTGFVSMLAFVDERTSLEVGLIGNEGMLGMPLALGVNVSSLRAIVQGAGTALRMKASDFETVLNGSPAFRSILNRYAHVLISQLAQVAACTCFHVIEARLARWMLMTHDRAHADRFHLTHELMAEMLGVRRAGVSTAAAALQTRSLISYNRGDITVLDRGGLEAAACACYQASENMYRSVST